MFGRTLVLLLSLISLRAGAVNCVSVHSFDRSPARPLGVFNADRLRNQDFELTQFPQLQEGWLQNPQTFKNRGDMFRASLQGLAVIGKKVPKGNLKEAAWVQELNRLGLGPKLHGLVEKNNDLYFVMTDVGGINTQMALTAPVGFKLNADVMREMERQKNILVEHGIFPVDIQFQISLDRKRVVLIDPEAFQIRDAGQELERQAQQTLTTVVMNWRMDDRVED